MDREVQKKLQEITRKTNAHLFRKLIKQERPMDETRRILEEAQNNGMLGIKERKQIREMLARPEVQQSMNRVTTTINTELQDEMDRRLTNAINRAKKRGQLPEPDMREYNSYMKKIHKGKV